VPVGRSGKTAQYIRSDVRLAPGNSGGPMLDASGAVIGISAMIFGGDLSVGIPSHVATEWVAGIPSRRVYLGVGLQPVELAAPQGIREGLMIVAIEPDGAASRAGLHIGDVLLGIGDETLKGPDHLVSALARAGRQVRIQLMRAGNTREVDVDLGDQAEETLS
jgi:serine protease Do